MCFADLRAVDDTPMIYNGMFFNERFSLDGVRSMSSELEHAFYDGLPYPMLKILEYFSLSQGAFAWGKQYRNAGHFAGTLVWSVFNRIFFFVFCDEAASLTAKFGLHNAFPF